MSSRRHLVAILVLTIRVRGTCLVTQVLVVASATITLLLLQEVILRLLRFLLSLLVLRRVLTHDVHRVTLVNLLNFETLGA